MTISLPRRLVERLDDEVRAGQRATRSAAILAALEDYYARRVGDAVREATIAYYRGLSGDEREDEERLAQASRRAAGEVLRKEAGRAPRTRRRRRGQP